MNFYTFKFRQRRGVIFLESSEEYNAMDVFKGIVTPASPLKTSINRGTTYHTYAYLPDPYNIAFKKEIINRLTESQITGWKSFAVDIRNSDFKYCSLQITGKCGKLFRPAKPGYVQGMQFPIETWDGSDFFSPEDTGGTLFTEKVRSFF